MRFNKHCADPDWLSCTTRKGVHNALQLLSALYAVLAAMLLSAYNKHPGHQERQQPCNGDRCMLLSGRGTDGIELFARFITGVCSLTAAQSRFVRYILPKRGTSAIALPKVSGRGVIKHIQLSFQSHMRSGGALVFFNRTSPPSTFRLQCLWAWSSGTAIWLLLGLETGMVWS